VVDKLVYLIVRAAQEVAQREGVALPADLGPDTPLFGERGLFDSLGLVSLVVTVEEGIQDQLGVALTLADERAMSQLRSPFRSVRTLADYAQRLIEESGADRR
jgi:acyl carrier protein